MMAMQAMAQHNETKSTIKTKLVDDTPSDKSMHDIINDIVEEDPTVLTEQIDEKKKEE